MNAATEITSAASNATESEKLAEFALGLNLSEVPHEVRETAKEHLLDALGIAIASTGFDFGRVALAAVRRMGEGTQARAIGTGDRLPPASAALLNGVLVHGLDFDDTHIAGIYHASAPALAACLATGEARSSSGAEVLTAFIVALEIGSRLATAAKGDFNVRGFHPTALCGTFAALYGAGRLEQADHGALVNAVGIAGSMSSGVLEGVGSSWLKRLHPGWSAHSALIALALGSAGFTGPATALEGAKGFYANHMGRVPDTHELPSHGLRSHWEIPNIALKPYPCCHFLHAFVDAALALRGSFELDQVERIDCLLTPVKHQMLAEPREECIRPDSPYRAQFSVQYVTALALVRGRVTLASFHDEALDAPEVLAIAARTFCLPDPDSDYPRHFPGEVIVHLKRGERLRCRKPVSLGTPETPMSRQAIVAKFFDNATRVISEEAARALAARILKLEQQPSIGDLLALAVVDTRATLSDGAAT